MFSKSKSFSDERNAIASERSRSDGRRDGRTRARITPPELRAECRTLGNFFGNFSQVQVHFCPKERRCERSFGLLSETFRANVPFGWTSAGRKILAGLEATWRRQTRSRRAVENDFLDFCPRHSEEMYLFLSWADGRRDGRTRARMTPPELRAECRTLGNFFGNFS